MQLPSFKRWLYKMEYKHSKHAVQNLMLIISAGMLIVLIGGIMNPQLISMLTLDRAAIMQGQVWRLFSFIFVPPISSNLIFTLIGIYFYYFIGSTLENTWGAFKFNMYYLCGIVALIISAMVTGYADSFFLNMSLFFAFAALYPEQEVRLFFILPVKIKWLAWLNAALYLWQFIVGDWAVRGSIIAVVVVLAIFFWSDIMGQIQNYTKYNKTRQNFKNNYYKNNNGDNTINFK